MQNTLTGPQIVYMTGITLNVLGALFLVIGLGWTISTKKKIKRCTAHVEAVVRSVKREVNLSAGTDSCRSWFTTFAFYANGQEVTVKSNLGTEKKLFEEGERLTLYYNPDNTKEFYVPKEVDTAPQQVFLIVGIGLIAVGTLGTLIILSSYAK